jgi:hypothetical protein
MKDPSRHPLVLQLQSMGAKLIEIRRAPPPPPPAARWLEGRPELPAGPTIGPPALAPAPRTPLAPFRWADVVELPPDVKKTDNRIPNPLD